MPVTKTIQLTITGVAKAVDGRSDVPEKKRGEICSALKRLCDVTRVDPHSTVADPAVLRKLFASHLWKQEGLSKGTWSNVKSLAKHGFDLAGIKIHRSRSNYAVSPAWQEVLRELPKLPARDLRRFAGWATSLDILPKNVTAEVLSRFLTYCMEMMTLKNPRESWHVARRAWNKAVGLGLIEGGKEVEAPELQRWRVMSWSAFPAALEQDFRDFVSDRSKIKLVVDKRKGQLRPKTVENYDRDLRTLATCLVEDGKKADSLTDLSVLLTPQNILSGLETYLRDDDPESPPPRLHAVATAARSVAKWLYEKGRLSEEAIALVRKYGDSVKHTPTVMTDKNVRRLSQFKDPTVVKAFLDLPYRVFDRLASVKVPKLRQAQEAQMAALLVMLIHAPVRINNARQLSFEKNITRMKRGGDNVWLLEWKEGEVKNKVVLRHELTASCSALLETYCARYRPLLMKTPRNELFLSQSGSAKGESALGKQLAKFVTRELGIEFNAHLIRHLVVFLFLKMYPGQYVTLQRLLGHKSIRTTISFYSGLESEYDHLHYDKMLTELREGSSENGNWEDRL